MSHLSEMERAVGAGLVLKRGIVLKGGNLLQNEECLPKRGMLACTETRNGVAKRGILKQEKRLFALGWVK
jgi:hypothetical protein